MRKWRVFAAAISFACWAPLVTQAETKLDTEKLAKLDLEDLMQIEVSSVSRKSESLSKAPAAVFVITSDDIRRSGATSVPEALRLAPGLEVARINGNTWAVSARGFNGQFANKLLVLVDGRSVYTPLYSGVDWDTLDLPLDEIERIEVIRGPGATLWGANAVNGVINIILKHSKDTQGGKISTIVGDEDRFIGTARYGGKLSEDSTYRTHLKFSDRDQQSALDGGGAGDGWSYLSGGFRADFQEHAANNFTFEGDLRSSNEGTRQIGGARALDFDQIRRPRSEDLHGGSLQGRWNYRASQDSEVKVQSYYQKSRRNGAAVGEDRGTFDFDLQHRYAVRPDLELLWGLGYRNDRDDLHTNSVTAIFDTSKQTDDLFSSFLQFDYRLSPSELHFIVGSKFEHNDYSGFEIQPNARLLWNSSEVGTLWLSVARAVRTPSLAESSIQFLVGQTETETGLPGLIYAFGNEDFDSEDLLATEMGYRNELARRTFIDLAVFRNNYANLRSGEPAAPFLASDGQSIIVPLILDNRVDGDVSGFESTLTFPILDWINFKSSYSLLLMDINPDKGSRELAQTRTQGLSPQNQINAWLAMNLPHQLELDLLMYYVDSLPDANIDAFTRFDARLGCKISEALSASVVVQNLFDDQHEEMSDFLSLIESTQVDRSFYGRLDWRF